MPGTQASRSSTSTLPPSKAQKALAASDSQEDADEGDDRDIERAEDDAEKAGSQPANDTGE